MATPEGMESLRRFLGMVNYIGKFIPSLTSIIKHLQDFTRNNTTWMWSESQQTAFNLVKELITSVTILAYYNPQRNLILENDSSEYGLGAALMQEERPVTYESHSLSETICTKRERNVGNSLWPGEVSSLHIWKIHEGSH